MAARAFAKRLEAGILVPAGGQRRHVPPWPAEMTSRSSLGLISGCCSRGTPWGYRPGRPGAASTPGPGSAPSATSARAASEDPLRIQVRRWAGPPWRRKRSAIASFTAPVTATAPKTEERRSLEPSAPPPAVAVARASPRRSASRTSAYSRSRSGRCTRSRRATLRRAARARRRLVRRRRAASSSASSGATARGKSTLLKCLAGHLRGRQRRRSTSTGGCRRSSSSASASTPTSPRATTSSSTRSCSASRRARRARASTTIIDFAELEEFVDLKLKNYSSGMQRAARRSR